MIAFLENLYAHARNTLVWFIVYFILQAIIWTVMGVLVLIYPQILFVLMAIFFVLFGALNLYFMLIFIGYALKLKRIKDYLKIN